MRTITRSPIKDTLPCSRMTQVTTEKAINIDTCPARLSLTKDDQVIFLACADLHLRDDTPICRTDDYQKAQMGKFRMMCNYAREFGVPILIAGDIFDNWKPSHRLVAQVINWTTGLMVIAVPGQHDLPQHNLQLLDKSGLGVLEAHGWHVLRGGGGGRELIPGLLIEGYSFGEEPQKYIKADVILWHTMNYPGKPPYPGCEAPHCSKLVDRFPNVKLIITGDNHETFTFTRNETVRIINPGAMMRATADQVDHEPVFFTVDKHLSCQRVKFPIEQGVISDRHLVRAKKRDEKMESFITSITKSTEISLSFESNMEKYFEKNKTDAAVKTMVLKSMEGN